MRVRISGTEADYQNGAVFKAYWSRYRAIFPNGEDGTFTSNAYDATYLISYAMTTAAAGDPVTGSAIATGMSKLVSGPLTEVGPSVIDATREVLNGGGTVDAVGASGPLDFNLATGEPPVDLNLWAEEERENGDLRFTVAMCYEIDMMALDVGATAPGSGEVRRRG